MTSVQHLAQLSRYKETEREEGGLATNCKDGSLSVDELQGCCTDRQLMCDMVLLGYNCIFVRYIQPGGTTSSTKRACLFDLTLSS